MITKRSISKPDSKKEAWRNRDKANDDITSSHCSRPLSSSQTTTRPDRTRPAAHRPTASRQGHPENRTRPSRGWRSGNPKAYPHRSPPAPRTREANDLFHTSTPTPDRRRSPAHGPHDGRRTGVLKKLRRKEVIQPHLPVRLPCYDLVPITSLTLDGSIHKGLGHRLRVLPTFMT